MKKIEVSQELGLGDMLSDFEKHVGKSDEERRKKVPVLTLSVNELVQHVFVDATIAVLAELGLEDREVLNVNDRTQMMEFPQADAATLEDLSDMAGFEVKPDTFLWQVAKALSTGETPKHRARSN